MDMPGPRAQENDMGSQLLGLGPEAGAGSRAGEQARREAGTSTRTMATTFKSVPLVITG